MKQVYLHFKEFELGALTQKDQVFIWVPNIQNIQLFNAKYDGASDMLLLGTDQPEVYEQIPYHFNEFVESASRPDLMKKAGINNDDSDFEKLCKMATLNFANQDFTIKA